METVRRNSGGRPEVNQKNRKGGPADGRIRKGGRKTANTTTYILFSQQKKKKINHNRYQTMKRKSRRNTTTKVEKEGFFSAL